MDPNKADISGFGRLFQNILSEGGDIGKKIEEKLQDKTTRVAFTKFAEEHPDLVSKSPLLSRASVYAEELNQNEVLHTDTLALTSTHEPVAHRIKKVGKARFNERLEELENAIFNPAKTSTPLAKLYREESGHLMSLYKAGLIGERQLSAIFSAKDGNGKTLLHNSINFSNTLPLLLKLAKKNPEFVVQLMSTKDGHGQIPLHDESIFKAFLPILKKLAETDLDFVITLISTPDNDGRMLIHNWLIFKSLLPILNKLAETDLPRVIELISTPDLSGVMPIHEFSISDDALPFLKKLAETDLPRAMKLLTTPTSLGRRLIDDPSILKDSWPDLIKYAHTDLNSVIQLLSTPNSNGERPIDKPVILKIAFPLFEMLLEKDPDLVIEILSKPDKDGKMPFMDRWVFIAFLPLLEKLVDKRPDSLVQLIPAEHQVLLGPLFYDDSFEAAQPLLEKLAVCRPEHVFTLLATPSGQFQSKPINGIGVLKSVKTLLKLLANSNPPLLVRLLSDRNREGTTPLERLDYLTEAIPLIKELGLQNSPSIKAIISVGCPDDQDLQQLKSFAQELGNKHKMTELALGQLKTFAKKNRDLLIQALSLRDLIAGVVLDDHDNFKLVFPLLTEWAEHAPELFISVLTTGRPLSLHSNLEMMIPVLQRFADHSSYDVLGEILNRSVISTLGSLVQLRHNPESAVHLYRQLLSSPLDPEILKSLAQNALFYEVFNQEDPAFHLAVSLSETNPENTNSPVSIYKRHQAWQDTPFPKRVKVPYAVEEDSSLEGEASHKRKKGGFADEAGEGSSSKRVKISLDDEEDMASQEEPALKRKKGVVTGEADAEPSAKRVKSSPVEAQPPQTFAGIARASLSLEGLQRASEEAVVTRDMIPPAATVENWHRARESLRARIEELPTPRESYNDFNKLWDRCLNDPFFEECLNFREGQEIKPYKAQWAAILNWILSLDNTIPKREANALSPQQVALYLAAYSYVYCDTGKEINIAAQYHALPPGFKLSIKGLDTSENELQLRARFAMMSFLRECVTQMIGSNRVLEDLTGIVGHDQAVHDIKYIKNAIGWIVGLGKTLSYDPHAPVIAQNLVEMERDVLLERFLNHLTPRALINALIRASENETQFKLPGEESFGDSARSLISNSTAFWDIDPATDLPFRLNERGALELLRILGVVDVAEPPILLQCPSAFSEVLGMSSAKEKQPFVWIENKDISYQLGSLRSSTVPRLRGNFRNLHSWIRHSDALETQIKEAWIGKDPALRDAILSTWPECSADLKLALLSSFKYWDEKLKGIIQQQWRSCDSKVKGKILDAWQLPQGSSLEDLLHLWNSATDAQKNLAKQFIDGKSAALKQALMGQWEKCSPSMRGEIIKLIPDASMSKFQSGWDRLVSEVSRDYIGPVSALIEDRLQDYPHPLSLVTLLEQKDQIADVLSPAANVQLKIKVKEAIADRVFASIRELLKGDLHPALLDAATLLVELLPADKGKELTVLLSAPDFQQKRWEAFKNATVSFKEYLQQEGFQIDLFMQYCHEAYQLLPSTALESFKDFQSVQQEFESMIQIAKEHSKKEHVFDLKEAKAKYDLLAERLGQAPMEIAMDE